MSHGVCNGLRRCLAACRWLYVAKLLKGADPAALPVEQPTKFMIAINLKTAKALGLTLSPSLLYQADLVIR